MAKKHNVLIVEDERIISEDIKLIVNRTPHYQVSGIVASGKDAIDSLDQNKPDIILMDISLFGPDDGIATAAYIKLSYGIPIIFITAHVDKATLLRVKHIEPEGYIVKPYTKHSIIAALNKAADKLALLQKV